MENINKRLVIVDHYDELINQIDLYTEDLLEKTNKTAVITELARFPSQNIKDEDIAEECASVVPKNPELEDLEDRYSEEYDLSGEENDTLDVNVVLGETKVVDYINTVRSKAIEEIRKAQEENLERLASSSPVFEKSLDKGEQAAMDISSDESDYMDTNDTNKRIYMEKLRSRLFEEKFCFFVMVEELPFDPLFTRLQVENAPKSKSIFKMLILVVDFYMSLDDIEILEKFINDKLSTRDSIHTKKTDFDEKHMLIHLLWKYICDRLIDYPKFGSEVIKVTKQKLLSIQKCHYVHETIKIKKTEIPGSLYDFSRLKSMYFGNGMINRTKTSEVVTLKGMPNLEHLSLDCAFFNGTIFGDLLLLRSLKLNNCDLSTLDDSFVNLPNLESLIIYQDSEEKRKALASINFKPLSNLKRLCITCKLNHEYLLKEFLSVSNELLTLKLERCEINQKSAEYLFKEVLPRFRSLIKLEIGTNLIKWINKDWFARASALKVLDLDENRIEEINSEDFLHLENLEILNLASNKIRMLKENTFSYLKSLRSLDLSDNLIKNVHSNAFKGLDKLEALILQNFGFFKTTKTLKADWFQHMNRLTKLCVKSCQINAIDSNVFLHMPKLEHLNLSNNRFELKTNTFQNLPNLKVLYLTDCNLRTIEANSFKALSSLEKLNLKENKLKRLEPDVFCGLENLRVLKLDSNELEKISNDTFKHLKKIELISLENNPGLDSKSINDILATLNIPFKK